MNPAEMNLTSTVANRTDQFDGGRPPHRIAMDAAAEQLGLKPAELRQQLDQGKTLTDLAASAGISTEDLKAAMAAAVQESAPASAAQRVVSGLDSIIAGERPKGPPPGPRPGGGPTESTETDPFAELLEILAEALDTDSETILESITDGSFASLIEKNGLAGSVGLAVDQAL